MSYVDDRETFFSTDKDTAMSHGMTAQYLNECVLKRNGMEVVDADGDVWGWVYDCHKDVGKWVVADTHDMRVKDMSEGRGGPAALPDYEPYRFVEETDPTETTYPAPTADDSDDDWSDCEPITGGITVTGDQSPYLDPTYYADHMHVPINDPVNPGHYRAHPSGVECIQITEHMNFNLGNTIKYVWRAGLKTDDPAEDIKKALWYLRRELSRIEAQK